LRYLVFALLASVLACADGTAPVAPAPKPDRVMVIFQGAPQRNYRPAYQPDSLVRYLVGFEGGVPRGRIASSVVLAELYAPSGRVLTRWVCKRMGAECATRADWYLWLDTTIAFLHRLDAAAAQANAWFGPRVIQVVPTILYPEPGRVKDVAEYADSLEARFTRAQYHNLRLGGYYWLHETMGDQQRDSLILPAVSAIAHARGRELWWIPYWKAPGIENWRRYGFDRVWIQPNHYFNPAVPDRRLAKSVTAAQTAGTGLELEFSGPGPYQRLDPYLESGKAIESLAVYEGGGALLRLEQEDPWRYRRLVDLLMGEAAEE
jgi:hypothetical protein